MKSDIDELARAVLKKPLEECTVEELQQAAEQYPYFGPIQLLLAKKISESSPYTDDNSTQYEEQVQKASLYFQNRVWLHHLLNNDNSEAATRVQLSVTTAEAPAQNEEEARTVDFDYHQKTEAEIINELPKEEFSEPTPMAFDIVSINTESAEAPPQNEEEAKPVDFDYHQKTEADIINELPKEEFSEPTPMAFDIVSINTESAEAAPQNEEEAKPVDFDYHQKTEGGLINELPKEELIEPKQIAADIVSMNTEAVEQALTNNKTEEQVYPVIDEPHKTHQTNSPSEMTSAIHEPTPGNMPMAFEPYHTVDYFASQGIKFKEEEKPKDRLGMQLKSFTEWLKTLKHVSVSELVSNVDSTAEKKVEQLAEFSVAERHVITEAMAEVWKKQGNRAKSEEIYRKLSLLDPSKSSYFAAKIEELKKIN